MKAVPQDIATSVAKNAALKAQLAEHDRRLAECSDLVAQAQRTHRRAWADEGENSRNSGKAPSSESPGKPRARERLRHGSCSFCGQPGHSGGKLRLSGPTNHIFDHVPKVCGR